MALVTTSELINVLYSHLVTNLKPLINGDVYKRGSRPLNSNKVDAVINSLASNNAQLSESVLNVNIHVPDETHNIAGISQTMPNNVKIEEMEKAGKDILTDQWFSDDNGTKINFDIEQTRVFPDESAKSHFINFRLKFYSLNISN